MTALDTLRSELRSDIIKIDPNWKVWSDAILDRLINQWYRKVQNDWQYRWRENDNTFTDYTAVAWTNEYDWPSDFGKLDLVQYNTDILRPTSKKELLIRLKEFKSGTPFWYYIVGSKLWVEPIPNNGWTIRMYYFKRLPTITSSQDSLFDEAFDYAMLTWAWFKAFSPTNPDKAAYRKSVYDEEIKELQQTFLYDDTNLSWWQQRPHDWPGYYRDDALTYDYC